MVNSTATEFLKKVLSDEALKARVSDPSQAVAVAAELGFEVTEEELIAAEKELRMQSEQGNAEVVELNETDMDGAAGGAWWNGEEAPDGHEMGCRLFFHDHTYSEETGTWCEITYYAKACVSGLCVQLSHG
ncbi:MAG: Nif11-like leader peptide family natural product precursor [Clostridia bacterium]|nr:Nif11-like leader peptide family natural product precursor [Clostridia bacterium]